MRTEPCATSEPEAGGSSARQEAARAPAAHDIWVFGYGSLMWRPGFRFAEAVHARVAGYHRAFCIHSTHYRGTPKRPGLVLGLDRGGVCEGVAFRVPAADAADALAYLRVREQVTGVYREKIVPVELMNAARGTVPAVTYVAERQHPSYAGQLPLARQAHLIRGGRGIGGLNIEYFVNTLAHLEELGICDRNLQRLATVLGGFLQGADCGRREGEECPRARALGAIAARMPSGVPPIRPDQRKRFKYRIALSAMR